MAQVCNTCFTTCPTLTRGRCPRCAGHDERTRRPPSHQRYPAEYHRNRTILLRDQPTCHWCGAPATTADHYPITVAQGGGHDLDNLVPACGKCNSGRGNRSGGPGTALNQPS